MRAAPRCHLLIRVGAQKLKASLILPFGCDPRGQLRLCYKDIRDRSFTRPGTARLELEKAKKHIFHTVFIVDLLFM